MIKFAVIAFFGLLASCELPAPAPNAWDQLQQQQRDREAEQQRTNRRLTQGLNSLIGQWQQVAVTKLGYPSQSRVMMGDTVYAWMSSFTFPATETMGPMTVTCTIEVGIGQDGIIKTAGYDGLCNRYAASFSPVP